MLLKLVDPRLSPKMFYSVPKIFLSNKKVPCTLHLYKFFRKMTP